ncbi:MAG TPA: NrfD/PsrC family molybdoenzyme membrane anchor subunit, partial [Kofleriaceae bacterium]
HPERANSAAAVRLAYDVAHRAPWDARVSLYTWTKGIAAGVYLVGLLLLALGAIDAGGAVWRWSVPIAAVAAVAVTGAVLSADLDHPERCLLIFTRRHGRSWLVRGAFVLVGYGGVLAVHLVTSLLGAPGAPVPLSVWLAIAGGPLAAMAAVYTAFLFAQCKARDLWQSPLLPPHLIVQAVVAGAAVLLLIDTLAGGAAVGPGPTLARILAIASLAHVAVALAEIALTHGTAHARLAAHEMTRGRYRRWFWAGLALTALGALGALAPWLPVAPPIAALAGLYAFEHAHVQAGQAVPLA